MSMLEIFRALGDGHLRGGAKNRTPSHQHDDNRSDAWNAWRERQALHPRGSIIGVGRAAPKRPVTAQELRARRLSSRASRRRTARNKVGAS